MLHNHRQTDPGLFRYWFAKSVFLYQTDIDKQTQKLAFWWETNHKGERGNILLVSQISRKCNLHRPDNDIVSV